MEFVRQSIPEVVLVKHRIIGDARGFFMERHRASLFAAASLPDRFVQINHSRSARNTLRGLHFQKAGAAQGKLVGCLRGTVFDVAVDVRRGSPHFGRWVGALLSDENGHQLWVPEGFAHGFVVRSEEADLVYGVSGAEYSPEHDRGILWDDPAIGIDWEVVAPLLSEHDRGHPSLAEADTDFSYREDT